MSAKPDPRSTGPAIANAIKAASQPATAPKRKRTAPPVDPRETPDARFKRIASKRLGRALTAMKGLEQLGKSRARKEKDPADSNPNAFVWKRNKDGSTTGYSYTEGQAEKVIQYLTDAVAAVKVALAPSQAMKASQELIDLG